MSKGFKAVSIALVVVSVVLMGISSWILAGMPGHPAHVQLVVQTHVVRVPGPVATRTVTRIVTKPVDIPVPGPTVVRTQYVGGYQYPYQDPYWNCWGDLINNVTYSAFCQAHVPN